MRTLALAFAAALVAMPAAAQQHRPPLTGNVDADIAAAKARLSGQPQGSNEGGGVSTGGGGGGGGIQNLLAKPLQDLVNFIGTDNTGAIELSTKIPNLQDFNGKACWMQTADFVSVIQVHPIPLTFKLMTDVQAARLQIWAAYNLCHSTACNIVFTDLQNEATALAGGLPTPNVFSQICGRVINLAPQLPLAALPAAVTAPSPAAPATAPTTPVTPTPAPASPNP